MRPARRGTRCCALPPARRCAPRPSRSRSSTSRSAPRGARPARPRLADAVGRGERSSRQGPPTRCRAGSRRPSRCLPSWATERASATEPRRRRSRRASCRTRIARAATLLRRRRRTPRSAPRRRRTARASDRQNAYPSCSPSDRMSTVTKYVPADGYTVSPALMSPAESRSRFSRSSSPSALIRSSGRRSPTAIAGWNGASVHVGEELLRSADRPHERGRRADPPDLPPRARERLAAGGDRDDTVAHAGQRGEWDVRTVEHDVLVHLVGDRDEVVLEAERGDDLELVTRQHLARGVVR